ncbi:methylmalonyl-CoA mutase [Brevibacillus panacihumi W25]|uniref:methylmalonyl-CoA mutase n=1 Tax=Brevibacillus panacihumi W25 TaxID=1408254 RepID=V6MKB8_9BACL|nr:methylmalonyl-CoA mutase family protein [Brevibacillus panacihumi]EST55903.1 methylmalonyl-CoA mutase [Brevibacillus panacihumi W25]
MSNKRLFQEFAVPTYEQWREEAEKSLKGASFDAKLLTKTYEGITLQPIYREEDVKDLAHLTGLPGAAPYIRGTRALGVAAKGWEVSQEIGEATPEAFNKTIKHDLERGQTTVNLLLNHAALLDQDEDTGAGMARDNHGVSIFCREDMDVALAGVDLAKYPLFLHTGFVTLPMLTLLLAHLEKTGQETTCLKGFVGSDPLGTLIADGQLPCPLQDAYEDMAAVVKWANQHAPGLRTIHVMSHPYHNAGANAVQELAFGLAAGVEHIRELLKRGLTIEQIAPKMQFSFSIGSQVFMEISKLRAARLLWSTIIEAYGGSPEAQKMNIHARTSAWTKTVLDPYVNMLRASTEAFSAIVGGIDSLHVSAFDEAIRPANEFSRRIARNTQIILEQEAHLAKVADPAGGSWYVEWLTDQIAQKAWGLFQQVEELGGMLSAIKSGFVQAQIEQVAAKKAENIAQRKDRIVGTNMYPNIEEPPLEKEKFIRGAAQQADASIQATLLQSLQQTRITSPEWIEQAVQAVHAGATLRTLAKAVLSTEYAPTSVRPLRKQRAAEAFEGLRQRADQYREKNGHRPTVYLASMGALAKHKARADFSAEFFAVGGFAVLRPAPAASVEEAAAEAIASGAPVVAICSDDESYPSIVVPFAQRIKAARPEVVLLLAGLPGTEQMDEYRAAGVDDWIHVRTNAYQMLHDLQERIGVMS